MCHVAASGHATDRGQHSIGAVPMLFSSMPESVQPQVLLPGSVPMLHSLCHTKNMVSLATTDSASHVDVRLDFMLP